jgi:hypothetical protein
MLDFISVAIILLGFGVGAIGSLYYFLRRNANFRKYMIGSSISCLFIVLFGAGLVLTIGMINRLDITNNLVLNVMVSFVPCILVLLVGTAIYTLFIAKIESVKFSTGLTNPVYREVRLGYFIVGLLSIAGGVITGGIIVILRWLFGVF